ncbi:MAG: acyl-CoA dehydrogenase family protein [Methylococcales bacterium]
MDEASQGLDFRKTIADLGAALSEDHIGFDQRAEFPWHKWQMIRDSGILGLPFPTEFGGSNQDLTTTMTVLEELGYQCADSGLNMAVSTQIVSTGIPLLRFGSADQKQRYLPGVSSGETICAHAITEPGGGSDAFGMATTAEKCGDRYTLNGCKTLITNGPIAEIFVIYAMTNRNLGALGGGSVFLVERGTPGFRTGAPIPKMGLRTMQFCELEFDHCEISEDSLLGKPGLGFPILEYVMKWEILCGFAITVGEMRRRLGKCIGYAKKRKQFGQSIGSYQAIANKIVDMQVGLTTSREQLYRTAGKIQRKENASIDLAIAKLITSEANLQSALNAVQIFGGKGYLVEYGIEKELRNSIAGTIYSGTSEIQRNKIASLLGI